MKISFFENVIDLFISDLKFQLNILINLYQDSHQYFLELLSYIS